MEGLIFGILQYFDIKYYLDIDICTAKKLDFVT